MLDFLRRTLRRGPPQDEGARFERLAAPHCQRLFEIACLLCGDADEAADLLQETLVRAFRAFDRFRPGAPMMPWLVTILKNLHRDELRSAHHRHETAVDVELDERLLQITDERADSLGQLEQAELGRRLAALLGELPEHYSLPVLLVDVQELRYEEAAAVLGVPIGTLRSRLARGRGLLRKKLFEERELPRAGPRTP